MLGVTLLLVTAALPALGPRPSSFIKQGVKVKMKGLWGGKDLPPPLLLPFLSLLEHCRYKLLAPRATCTDWQGFAWWH